MTKKELVKNAYEQFYEYVENSADENGWVKREEHSGFIRNHFYLGNNIETKFIDKVEYWRPKTLEGIETNNGWILIKSEEDLPREKEMHHFIPCGNFEEAFTGFIDHSWGEVFFIDKYYESKSNHTLHMNSWMISQITHYQPITKPNPPLWTEEK